MTGVWVLMAAVVLAGVIGLVMRGRDGRFRAAPGRVRSRPASAARPAGSEPERTSVDGDLPDRVLPRPGTPAAADPAARPDSAEQPGSSEPSAASAVPPAPRAGDLLGELAALGEEPGQVATLLQFSTAFCAPCRTTRRLLADVASIVPGVRHVEVDAESHLELVRRLAIRRTPTVLVLDGAGVEVRRASGAPPTRAAVIATLAALGGPAAEGHQSVDSGDSVDLSRKD